MAFSPEEISQILEEFFKVIGTRQYIGARYVPIFGRKDETSIEWDNSAPYEPLTIVLYQGNSYTSRQFVPSGVNILNQDYWASTGIYNAQVEQYRQEVLAITGTVDSLEESIESVTELVTNMGQEIDSLEDETETLTTNVNSLTDTTSTLNNKVEALENTSATLVDTVDTLEDTTNAIKEDVASLNDDVSALQSEPKPTSILDNSYLGRIHFNNSQNAVTGGCALIDDETLIFTACNNDTTNDVDIYRVDLYNKTTAAPITRQWYHANSVAYNRSSNKLYVSPNWDYVNGTRLTTILECNPVTFAVTNTFTFEFEPHAICCDNVTGKTYIIGTPEFTIYEFDATSGQASALFTIPRSEIMQKVNSIDGNIGGWQDAAAYDNAIAMLMSGEHGNNVLIVDLQTKDFKFYSINRNVGPFFDPEAEGIDFTSKGNLIIGGRARVAGNDKLLGTIYEVPMFGFVEIGDTGTQYEGRTTPCYVNGTLDKNYTIHPNGTSAAPFPTFIEGYIGLKNTFHKAITVSGDTTLENMGTFEYQDFTLNINANVTLLVQSATYFKNVRFAGASTHGIIKKVSGTSMPLRCFGVCTFRQLNFDSANEDTTTNYFVQGRAALIILVDCDRINNTNNVTEFRGDAGGIILVDTNSTVIASGYTGTIQP